MTELKSTLQTPSNLQLDEREGPISWERIIKIFNWNKGGSYNLAAEAVDRHIAEGFGGKIALRYVDESRDFTWTFLQLAHRVDYWMNRFLSLEIQKGDRVFIFLPRVPDLYAAILGAIKMGAIAGPLFEAFYADALRDRLGDCGAKLLVTTPELAQRVPREDLPHLRQIILLEDLFPEVESNPQTKPLQAVNMDPDDGLIIHYTSGSTGKPKGILHAHRAMIQHAATGRWVLDLRDDDLYWCTAHPGWVTGSSYGVFAPWLNRATILINGGRFDALTWIRLLEKTGVTVLYSAPTVFRMIMATPPEAFQKLQHRLRHVLSVGEPLNPEVIEWGWKTLGVRIHDTWWMTETGAQLIVNLSHQTIRLGSMGKPLPGIEAAILDDSLLEVPRGELGQLAIKTPWPSLMKTVWNNPQKYASYFTEVKNRGVFYLSGDTARMDEDGYVYFIGRGDDVIVTSGEKVSPFEVESTLITHSKVAEAGVIAKPDPIRGDIVKAFVVLREGVQASGELAREIRDFVKTRLSAHAYPREVEIVAALPKTRVSGKIMRRVLKTWEAGGDIGDTTTLENGQRITLASSND